MTNNKGQVLVLFIIILPILLLLLLLIIEIGNIYVDKTKTQNIIKETINNSLKKYNENTNKKINELIEKNIKNIDSKTIFTSENEIRITIIQYQKLLGRKLKIEYKYKGIKQEEKITIEEG